jgi:hypothetical protein
MFASIYFAIRVGSIWAMCLTGVDAKMNILHAKVGFAIIVHPPSQNCLFKAVVVRQPSCRAGEKCHNKTVFSLNLSKLPFPLPHHELGQRDSIS